jgi:hypothetical protein
MFCVYILAMKVYPTFVLAIVMLANADPEMRIVDLTHAQNSATIYWPGLPSYNFTIIYRGHNPASGHWQVHMMVR